MLSTKRPGGMPADARLHQTHMPRDLHGVPPFVLGKCPTVRRAACRLGPASARLVLPLAVPISRSAAAAPPVLPTRLCARTALLPRLSVLLVLVLMLSPLLRRQFVQAFQVQALVVAAVLPACICRVPWRLVVRGGAAAAAVRSAAAAARSAAAAAPATAPPAAVEVGPPVRPAPARRVLPRFLLPSFTPRGAQVLKVHVEELVVQGGRRTRARLLAYTADVPCAHAHAPSKAVSGASRGSGRQLLGADLCRCRRLAAGVPMWHGICQK